MQWLLLNFLSSESYKKSQSGKNKENKRNVTKCGLILNWFLCKTYAESLSVNRKDVQKNHCRQIGEILALATIILVSIMVYLFKPHVSTTSLVTYNALVIAAAVFLLNFHFGELRDVSFWYIEGKSTANHSIEPFSFLHKNKTQPAAVKIIEVKASFIAVLLVSIIFLMVSSFIVIASIKVLNSLALALSIISSVGILAILIGTFYVYLKAAKEYGGKRQKPRRQGRSNNSGSTILF
jgi:hypothetical protein